VLIGREIPAPATDARIAVRDDPARSWTRRKTAAGATVRFTGDTSIAGAIRKEPSKSSITVVKNGKSWMRRGNSGDIHVIHLISAARRFLSFSCQEYQELLP